MASSLYNKLPLRSSSDDIPRNSEEKEPLFDDPDDHSHRPAQQRNSRGLVAAVIFFAFTTLVFSTLYISGLASRRQSHKFGSFHSGFVTEIVNGFPEIELQQVKFSGGLKYDERGHLYRNIDPSQPQYVGEPSPEMDTAWNDLIHDRYVAFHGAEYQGPGMDNIYEMPPFGTYRIGVDVLHSLHCLDRIRKVLDSEYYAEELAPEDGPHGRMHVDHCIDYIRQMLQCKADLTPLPVYWAEGANRTVPDFDVVHTCRDFRKIRDWADEQEKRTMEKYPDNVA